MVDVTVRVQLTNGFTVPLTNGFYVTAGFLIGTMTLSMLAGRMVSPYTRGESAYTRGRARSSLCALDLLGL